jgi:hypothetical protein
MGVLVIELAGALCLGVVLVSATLLVRTGRQLNELRLMAGCSTPPRLSGFAGPPVKRKIAILARRRLVMGSSLRDWLTRTRRGSRRRGSNCDWGSRSRQLSPCATAAFISSRVGIPPLAIACCGASLRRPPKPRVAKAQACDKCWTRFRYRFGGGAQAKQSCLQSSLCERP